MQDGSLPRLARGLTPLPAPNATLDSILEFHNLVLKVAVAFACHTHLANEGGRLSVNIGAGTNGRRSHLRGQLHPVWPPLGSEGLVSINQRSLCLLSQPPRDHDPSGMRPRQCPCPLPGSLLCPLERRDEEKYLYSHNKATHQGRTCIKSLGGLQQGWGAQCPIGARGKWGGQPHASYAHVTPWLWAGRKGDPFVSQFPHFSKQATWAPGSGTWGRGRLRQGLPGHLQGRWPVPVVTSQHWSCWCEQPSPLRTFFSLSARRTALARDAEACCHCKPR